MKRQGLLSLTGIALLGLIVLMTLHEPDFAFRYCDRIVLLHGGGEVRVGTPEAVLDDAELSRLYSTSIRRLEAGGEVFFRVG